jgi:hypothetical protein
MQKTQEYIWDTRMHTFLSTPSSLDDAGFEHAVMLQRMLGGLTFCLPTFTLIQFVANHRMHLQQLKVQTVQLVRLAPSGRKHGFAYMFSLALYT